MDSHQLRSLIIKLQDRLTNDDRIRLHFYLGDDIPRRMRDDLSLSGTLNLMNSLFDQDKINERDFTILITAFDEIHCSDAAKLLQQHLKQIQLNGLNQSMQSLSMIMPPILERFIEDQEEDKYLTGNLLTNQQLTCGNNNVMINSNNTNINRTPIIIKDKKIFSSTAKTQRILNSSFAVWIILVFLILIITIGFTISIILTAKNHNGIKQLKEKADDRHWRHMNNHKPIKHGSITIRTMSVMENDLFNVSCNQYIESSKLFIFSAIYQSKWYGPTCWTDVTDAIQRQCSSTVSCSFNVDNKLFEINSCPGILKELLVTYTCSTDRYIFGPVLTESDSHGFDIHQNGSEVSIGVATIEECGNKCLKVSECAGVVYAPNEKLCWLKRKMTQRVSKSDRNSMVIFNNDHLF